MNQKKIAVLLATHNSKKYIFEQIDSVLNQTHKNIVLAVSDDNSTDGTKDIIAEYAKKDERVIFVGGSEPLGSAQSNFMFLLNSAPKADYYMFCDHDDVWLGDKIEKTLSKMLEIEEENVPALMHTDLKVVDGSLNTMSESMFLSQQLSKNASLASTLIQSSATGCTMMLNNALLELAKQKKDANEMIMHDWFLSILALATGKMAFLDEPTILYRQHGNNEVGAKDTRSIKYILTKVSAFSKNKKSINDTYLQSKMIAELYKDALGENYQMIFEFGENLKKGKLARIKTSKKYGIWKNTLVRRIGQIIFM